MLNQLCCTASARISCIIHETVLFEIEFAHFRRYPTIFPQSFLNSPFSGKVPESDGYRSMRRRVPTQSPTKTFENHHARENYPLRENGYHARENGLRCAPHENGYHGNGFQRGIPGRQSLPVNQNNRYMAEHYGNMYYGAQRPPNATPTRTAVNQSYNNLGKV